MDITKELLRELHDATKEAEPIRLFAEWKKPEAKIEQTKRAEKKTCPQCLRSYDLPEDTVVKCKVCTGTEGKFLKSLREHVEWLFDKKFVSGSPMWSYDETLKRRISLQLYNDELKIVFDFGKKRDIVAATCEKHSYMYVRLTQPKLTLKNYNALRDHLNNQYIGDIYITGVLKRLENLYADNISMFAGERKGEVALGFALNDENVNRLLLIGSFHYMKK